MEGNPDWFLLSFCEWGVLTIAGINTCLHALACEEAASLNKSCRKKPENSILSALLTAAWGSDQTRIEC